jgi:hypothetical protein
MPLAYPTRPPLKPKRTFLHSSVVSYVSMGFHFDSGAFAFTESSALTSGQHQIPADQSERGGLAWLHAFGSLRKMSGMKKEGRKAAHSLGRLEGASLSNALRVFPPPEGRGGRDLCKLFDLLPRPRQREICYLRIIRRGFAGAQGLMCSASSKSRDLTPICQALSLAPAVDHYQLMDFSPVADSSPAWVTQGSV